MSKPTWAAVVKKPLTPTAATFVPLGVVVPVVAAPVVVAPVVEVNVSITDYPDLLPTEVPVPEPPPPMNSESTQPIASTDSNTSIINTYNLELRQIHRHKETLERDIQQKLEKFNTSYAYTRFNQDIEALNQQKKTLEEKEAEIKRAIILSTGSYSKRVLEVIGRIKRYLGSEAEYRSRYISRGGTISMYCKITYCNLDTMRCSLPEDLEENMAALRWVIQEEFPTPGHIQIVFTTYSQDMSSILEAAIKSELKGFVVYKN